MENHDHAPDLKNLEEQLRRENPLLVDAVASFRKLDFVGRRLGLLPKGGSFAARIAWWPLVAVLGPFSAGKSTFINSYLGQSLQHTGTHAVDDKFTVICHTTEPSSRVLPGVALDADLRFPFYKMSQELEKVEAGEGGRIDAYLQLKTCPGERAKGLILIDSPGFDADAQRTATLRITDYIMDLSDLVLVLFDANRPEPGAMRDTLRHLVAGTVTRKDSNKFLYVLNRMDVTAREDNPEEVVGAWQRSLAQHGLTAGKFYRVYSPEAALPIADEALARRFAAKRDKDLAEIHGRMAQVRVERAYRIVGALEKMAREIEDDFVPRIRDLAARWRKGVLRFDALFFGIAAALCVAASFASGPAAEGSFLPGWLDWIFSASWRAWPFAALVLAGAGFIHAKARGLAEGRLRRALARENPPGALREALERAMDKNTVWWRSIFASEPAGWGNASRRRIREAIAGAESLVQALNDRYAQPSGPRPEPSDTPTTL
ncbi:dynamin family protein [Desulfolutivibrio sp.]|uniref:dynamin family protein n=1 Tax=Desulfolutivibrio sp. TaxID=2773296 RepID=UPI002F9694C6